MARPRIHDDQTRDHMVDVAGALLRREGPTALTVRRVADEAGASTGALYRLFGSKTDVVQAMFHAGFANLDAHLAAVTASDPVDRIRDLALAYRAAARERPHLYDVMFACPFPDFQPDAHDQALSLGTLSRLRDAVAEAVAAGRLAGNPAAVTMGLWAVVHGLATLELAGSLEAWSDADEVWATTLSAALSGFAVADPGPPHA